MVLSNTNTTQFRFVLWLVLLVNFWKWACTCDLFDVTWNPSAFSPNNSVFDLCYVIVLDFLTLIFSVYTDRCSDMAGVFDLELHDTPEGDEEISDDEFFEPELEVWCRTGVFHISSSFVTNIYLVSHCWVYLV